MLPTRVYHRLYEEARKAGEGLLVEVGTAHGAGTVCLARGVREQRTEGAAAVHTFEKIVGGSREKYGGVEENIRIIEDNFRRFGVEETVQLHVGDVREKHDAIPGDARICLMLLDSDGCIDRDFRLFYDRLKPGGSIVIDDYDDKVIARKICDGRRFVDQKLKLTKGLVDLLVAKRFLEPDFELVGQTVFARKPNKAKSITNLSFAAVTEVYRSLVFARSKDVSLRGRMKKRLLNLARRQFPRALARRYEKQLGEDDPR